MRAAPARRTAGADWDMGMAFPEAISQQRSRPLHRNRSHARLNFRVTRGSVKILAALLLWRLLETGERRVERARGPWSNAAGSGPRRNSGGIFRGQKQSPRRMMAMTRVGRRGRLPPGLPFARGRVVLCMGAELGRLARKLFLTSRDLRHQRGRCVFRTRFPGAGRLPPAAKRAGKRGGEPSQRSTGCSAPPSTASSNTTAGRSPVISPCRR